MTSPIVDLLLNEPSLGSASIAAQKDTSKNDTDSVHKEITALGFNYPDVGPAKVTVHYYLDGGCVGEELNEEGHAAHRDNYHLFKEGGAQLYITNMGVPGHCMYFQNLPTFTRIWEKLMNGPDQVPAKYRFWVTASSLQVSAGHTHTDGMHLWPRT